MFIGDLLVAHGLVTPEDVAMALDRQKLHGGRLGDILIALGRMSAADLNAVLQVAPEVPASILDTGLNPADLLNLTMKAMYANSAETPSAIVDIVKLPNRIVQLVLEQAKERRLVEVLGAASIRVTSEFRFALLSSALSRDWRSRGISSNRSAPPSIRVVRSCSTVRRATARRRSPSASARSSRT